MIENPLIYISCLFIFSEKNQFNSEEIYIKDEPLFPASEDDKVGCM